MKYTSILLFTVSFLFCLALSCSPLSTFSSGGEQRFTRCERLDANFDLYWRIADGEITFAIMVRNNVGGWAAIGFSENGGMKGADIIVAQKKEGKHESIEDRYSSAYSEPLKDEHSDINFIDYKEDSTSTTIMFKRMLITCDGEQDLPITNKKMYVIYAYGSGSLHYHAEKRGIIYLNLFEEDKAQPLPDDAETMTIASPPFEVPSSSTTSYGCSFHALPPGKDFTILNISPVLRSSLVHHIIGYVCPQQPPDGSGDGMNGTAAICDQLEYCKDGIPTLLWSIAEGDVSYATEDYALSIGGAGTTYLKLEIHYNNPTPVKGEVDESGLTLTYTAKKKKNELGVLTLGATEEEILLPPYNPSIEITNECPEECTRKFNEGGLTVVAVGPYMHAAGSKFWIRHIRNGVELPYLYYTENYDFPRQQMYSVNRLILPGDRLITTCVYDTSDRRGVTEGGDKGDMPEQCLGFVLYYPRTSIDYCIDLSALDINQTICGQERIDNTYPRSPFTVLPVSDLKCKDTTNYLALTYSVFLFAGCIILMLYCARQEYIDYKIRSSFIPLFKFKASPPPSPSSTD